jgi:hypothetical protein
LRCGQRSPYQASYARRGPGARRASRRRQHRFETGAAVLFELRQYKIREGHKENWVRLMEDEIIPFQVAQGMVILGSFTGEDDDSIYVWIRRFKDEAERERLYEAVYDSDHWKENIGPRIPEMMDREAINVIRLDPTAKSPLQ